MRFTIDGKSAALGAFAGVAFLAGLGAMQKGEPPAGRYQVAAGGTNGSTTAYVVDTATGRVWVEPNALPSTQTYAAFLAPKLDAPE